MNINIEIHDERELIRLASFLSGGVNELCGKLKITKGAYFGWVNAGRVPEKRVKSLCRATGNRIRPWMLRPDKFKMPKK